MSDENITVMSVRLSELNSRQLQQLLNRIGHQRDAVVDESQALGRQVDQLRARRLALADQVRKYTLDEQHLLALIKLAQAREAVAGAANEATLESITTADIASVHAVAPGVMLEAKAKPV